MITIDVVDGNPSSVEMIRIVIKKILIWLQFYGWI